MDDHSRMLLGRSKLERRIRLVPRSLMIADLFGLSLAYVVTTLIWGSAGAFGSTKEMVVFCFTLPCWLVVARLQGLYRADQEHADHSTADDIVGVLYLVTVGVWVLLVASRLVGRTAPEHLCADHLLGGHDLRAAAGPDRHAPPVPAVPCLRPEHADPGRGRGRAADRTQAGQAP